MSTGDEDLIRRIVREEIATMRRRRAQQSQDFAEAVNVIGDSLQITQDVDLARMCIKCRLRHLPQNGVRPDSGDEHVLQHDLVRLKSSDGALELVVDVIGGGLLGQLTIKLVGDHETVGQHDDSPSVGGLNSPTVGAPEPGRNSHRSGPDGAAS